jgi:hypothetical protein
MIDLKMDGLLNVQSVISFNSPFSDNFLLPSFDLISRDAIVARANHLVVRKKTRLITLKYLISELQYVNDIE